MKSFKMLLHQDSVENAKIEIQHFFPEFDIEKWEAELRKIDNLTSKASN
jgi:hypothetical protein